MRVTIGSERSKEAAAPIACVLGEIDLVRALGLAGIRSAVAAVPGDPAGYSRHVAERLTWLDPWDRPEEMVDSLIAWAKRQDPKPVLFYNGDHDLLLVSRHRDRLADRFEFVIGEQDLIEDLVDKDRFSRLATERGLPVPAGFTFDPQETSPEGVAIDFPFVVKPVTLRHDTWEPLSPGGKAIRVDNNSDLGELWPRLQSQGPLIAQTLIEGGEEAIESYHAFFDASGHPVCEFTGRKIRTWPPEFGETTALEITDREDVTGVGRDVMKRLALTGVVKLDFKRDPGGRLWLLEVNPRFNLWHHAGARAGANIPAAVYSHLTARRAPTCSPRTGVTWCHPTRDARAARTAGMSLARWSRWAINCEAKWGMSWSDPMPFVRGVVVRRLSSKLRSR